MLTELHRKGGSLCQPAKQGEIICPLKIRPTSEDVITGHLVFALRVLNPRWWLPDLLNQGLGVKGFQRQMFRKLRIEPWVNKPSYPRELLPWNEGSTQVDVTISWENPPTTVYVEMKYGSGISLVTAQNRGHQEFPADQVSRNMRVGLLECGYFKIPQLFKTKQRDFLLLIIAPFGNESLVNKYRDPEQFRIATPCSNLIPKLPKLPFLGQLSYRDLINICRRNKRWFSRPEQIIIDQLKDYLEMKLATLPRKGKLYTVPLLRDFVWDDEKKKEESPEGISHDRLSLPGSGIDFADT